MRLEIYGVKLVTAGKTKRQKKNAREKKRDRRRKVKESKLAIKEAEKMHSDV